MLDLYLFLSFKACMMLWYRYFVANKIVKLEIRVLEMGTLDARGFYVWFPVLVKSFS